MTRLIHRRYQREFWPPMLAYVLVMLLLWPLLPGVHSDWLKIGLALLPLVPVLLVVRAMVRLVLASDELEQRIHLIGLAIAATVVSALSMAGGFLAAAGVLRLDGSVLLWVWPMLVVLYALGRGWASRRYGGDDTMMCGSGFAMHWRMLGASLALAMLAWAGHGRLSDYQFGLLCGMSVSLGLGAALQLVLRVRRMDELQRRIELTALSMVAVGTWLATVTCWLLQQAGANVPPLSTGFLILPLLYQLARRWVRRRY